MGTAFTVPVVTTMLSAFTVESRSTSFTSEALRHGLSQDSCGSKGSGEAARNRRRARLNSTEQSCRPVKALPQD
jgi:hypothetical protein